MSTIQKKNSLMAMNASLYRFGLLSLVCVSSLGAADIRLTLTRTGDLLQISFPTEVGKQYALESATDLGAWGAALLSKSGDGQTVLHDVDTSAAPARFFRLVVEDSAGGLAPSQEEAAELLVGGSWGGYEFVSTNRFDWNGEDGDWSYQKTGPNTGLLVFTYDADGNNPNVYREEVVMDFVTETTCNYRYSEYNGGVEAPGSVNTGVLDLSSVDLSPTAAEMAAILVGKSLEGYVFTSETRFYWPGTSKDYPGNWSYEEVDSRTARLIFTYDEDGNDPGVYYELMRLTFFTATSGVYRYAEYHDGELYRPSESNNNPFTLPSP